MMKIPPAPQERQNIDNEHPMSNFEVVTSSFQGSLFDIRYSHLFSSPFGKLCVSHIFCWTQGGDHVVLEASSQLLCKKRHVCNKLVSPPSTGGDQGEGGRDCLLHPHPDPPPSEGEGVSYCSNGNYSYPLCPAHHLWVRISLPKGEEEEGLPRQLL